MELQVAVAKVAKWASRESGDTLEMIERPSGGLSLVLVDGQHSGKGAKSISNLVARKAISLLAEGVRDGAAARAAHDYVYTHYEGKVQASLNIASIDLASKTLVLSRNNPNPTFVITPEGTTELAEPSRPVGLYRHTKPVISEIPLAPHTLVLIYTDGLPSAGIRRGMTFDVRAAVEKMRAGRATRAHSWAAQSWADDLLTNALTLDENRPADDISILVLTVLPKDEQDAARRLLVRMPL